MSFYEESETGSVSSEDVNDKESDLCRNILKIRRKSRLVTEDDVVDSSFDTDEESDFCSGINEMQGRNSQLGLKKGGSSYKLSLPPWDTMSWASEMSLLDKLTPGGRARAMANVRFPRTPPAITTPQEFKGINWKRLSCDIQENDGIDEELYGECEQKETVDCDSTSSLSDLTEEESEKRSKINMDERKEREPFPSPLKVDDDEQSELSIKLTNSSESESLMSSGDPIFDHTNLIVNYLPAEMNSTMLRELFSPYGTIVSCKVVVDHPSSVSKGYGFVKFRAESEGDVAQRALHKHRIGKKTLKVSFSRQAV